MNDETLTWTCPIPTPAADGAVISLVQGDGGAASRRLIQQHVARILGNDILCRFEDAAQLPALAGEIAFTTDSFVVSPLFFREEISASWPCSERSTI